MFGYKVLYLIIDKGVQICLYTLLHTFVHQLFTVYGVVSMFLAWGTYQPNVHIVGTLYRL